MFPYKIIMYPDAKGEWRFRIKASNGRIVADSAEGYKTPKACQKNIDKLRAKLPTAIQVKADA